jgi:hypothetical protein
MAKKSFKTSFDSLLEPTSERRGGAISSDKTKNVTFVVKVRHNDKLRAISYMKRQQIKDTLSEALEEYIEKYEKEFGEIKTPE